MSVLPAVTLRCDNMIKVTAKPEPCARTYVYNSSDINEARRGAMADHGWSVRIGKDFWNGQPIIEDVCGDCNARERKAHGLE